MILESSVDLFWQFLIGFSFSDTGICEGWREDCG